MRVLHYILATFLVACSGSSRTLPAAPSDGDATARKRFQHAHQAFQRDGQKNAGEFERIVADYPNDPIAPHARLYAGMAAFNQGDCKKAIPQLKEVALDTSLQKELREHGYLYWGHCLVEIADYPGAVRAYSHGFGAAKGAQKSYASWNYGKALAFVGRVESFAHWDGLREREADWNNRVQGVGNALPTDTLVGLVERGAISPSWRVLAQLALTRLRSNGDSRRVLALEARLNQGEPKTYAPDGSRWQHLVFNIPLTGHANRAGGAIQRVAGLITEQGTVQIRVHDNTSTTLGAGQGSRNIGDAMATIGPVAGDAVDVVAMNGDQVPVLSLNARGEVRKGTAFHLVHSAKQRSQRLARYALDAGVKDFAIFRPNNGYGRITAEAFREIVENTGGRIVVEATYDPKGTSFTDEVKKLSKPWQAVFVPDQARRLQLIAPALANGNLISRPWKSGKPRFGRKIWLLSTAEFLEPRFLKTTARYVWGAIVAPGFYPDMQDGSIAGFVQEYQARFEKLPTPLEAYAYDAVRFIQWLKPVSRQQLKDSLSSTTGYVGVTGPVEFGENGLRKDGGLLYQVIKDENSDFAIRALR